jgi:hypothetical protein
MFFSFQGSWLLFDCYQIVALKDAVHYRVKEITALGSTLQDESSERFQGEMIAKDLDAGLRNRQMFSARYRFEPL